jgi:hypothetical protein
MRSSLSGGIGWPELAALVLAGGLLGGCQEAPPDALAQGAPSPEVVRIQRELARPFVVFSSRTLEMERLEEPMVAPVLVGSRPSPQTLWSSDPDVVSIEQDGRLVAHRAGQAQISARNGGPALSVSVRTRHVENETAPTEHASPERLTVKPARVRLKLGDVQSFEALTPAGPVPGEWTTSNDRKVAHLQDHVFQGLEPGWAKVCARAGALRACSSVEVTP